MMDDCADIRFRLALFRRGELDETEAAAVRDHLARCPDCSAELEAERLLDHRLTQEKLAGSAPPELRRAVRDVIAREGASRRGRWHRSILRTPRRPAVAATLGAAAMLLVVAAMSLILARARQPDPLTVPLAEALAGHRRGVLETELRASEKADVDRVVTEIQQRLGVPTTTAFRGDADLRLVAVEPTYSLGHPGAILVFRDPDGRLVTLLIVRAPEVAIPRERGTPVGPFRPILRRQQDVSTALWKQGNAVYGLSAPVDEAEIARLYLKVRQGTSNP
ncbi:MAG: anti-sigma factor family protein [Candidatus Rokuibacteriota bacterium]